MSGFSVVSLNTQGCRNSFKRYFLLDSLKTKLNADIVFLQDIHTIPSEEDTWKLIWRGNILFSHLWSNTAGIAICFSNKLDHQILEHKIILPGRILHVTVWIQEQNYHLINVYIPTCPKEILIFLRSLKHHLNNLESSTLIFLGGDITCTINPKLDRTCDNEPHPQTSEEFKHIVKRFKLIDTFRNILPYQQTYF
jgi:exonuclease III